MRLWSNAIHEPKQKAITSTGDSTKRTVEKTSAKENLLRSWKDDCQKKTNTVEWGVIWTSLPEPSIPIFYCTDVVVKVELKGREHGAVRHMQSARQHPILCTGFAMSLKGKLHCHHVTGWWRWWRTPWGYFLRSCKVPELSEALNITDGSLWTHTLISCQVGPPGESGMVGFRYTLISCQVGPPGESGMVGFR